MTKKWDHVDALSTELQSDLFPKFSMLLRVAR